MQFSAYFFIALHRAYKEEEAYKEENQKKKPQKKKPIKRNP